MEVAEKFMFASIEKAKESIPLVAEIASNGVAGGAVFVACSMLSQRILGILRVSSASPVLGSVAGFTTVAGAGALIPAVSTGVSAASIEVLQGDVFDRRESSYSEGRPIILGKCSVSLTTHSQGQSTLEQHWRLF